MVDEDVAAPQGKEELGTPPHEKAKKKGAADTRAAEANASAALNIK